MTPDRLQEIRQRLVIAVQIGMDWYPEDITDLLAALATAEARLEGEIRDVAMLIEQRQELRDRLATAEAERDKARADWTEEHRIAKAIAVQLSTAEAEGRRQGIMDAATAIQQARGIQDNGSLIGPSQSACRYWALDVVRQLLPTAQTEETR